MFNKNIFQVWFQGKQDLQNKLFIENVKNWELLNPDWKYHFVDDNFLRNACKKFSKDCLKTYDSFDLIHLKIDFGRYVLLYLYGGIYVDMDMYILRGLDTSEKIQELIEKSKTEHVLGLSLLNLSVYESLLFIGKTQFINNAMMFATLKHPLLYLIINHIIKSQKLKQSFEGSRKLELHSNDSFNNIQNTTGPILINKLLSENYKPKGKPLFFIELFPHYYFEPSNFNNSFDITNKTITIHSMEMSWISPKLRNIIKFYYNIKPYLIFILFASILTYLKSN